jgi:hypothetical protein
MPPLLRPPLLRPHLQPLSLQRPLLPPPCRPQPSCHWTPRTPLPMTLLTRQASTRERLEGVRQPLICPGHVPSSASIAEHHPQPPRIPQRSSKSLPGERLARHYSTRAAHLGASLTCQKSPRAQWWKHAVTSKSSDTNIIKSCAGKRYWPHLRVRRLSRGGPGGHCRYPADQVPLCTRLKRLATEGSGSATCPDAQSTPPTRRGLQCRHVPHGTEHATRQERAPVSPSAPRHRAHHLPEKGSGVTTCPEAPSSSPGGRGL